MSVSRLRKLNLGRIAVEHFGQVGLDAFDQVEWRTKRWSCSYVACLSARRCARWHRPCTTVAPSAHAQGIDRSVNSTIADVAHGCVATEKPIPFVSSQSCSGERFTAVASGCALSKKVLRCIHHASSFFLLGENSFGENLMAAKPHQQYQSRRVSIHLLLAGDDVPPR